ncbi:Integral membrane protein [Rutstroemia sp. NJR-2017a WRK4]|nr:Integral membrane protein [Rutstroemia sp. NJR-2017a WRK4]
MSDDRLPLSGLSLGIFVVSLVFLALSFITVGLRAYLRHNEGVFGWDDGLMVSGLVVYIVDVALACHGATQGLGLRNAQLTPHFQVEGTKYLMLWMMLYVVALVVIKASICVTLLRIASVQRVYRISVWTLLTFIVLTFIATLVGILLLCDPVKANWETSLVAEGKATCRPMSVMIALSYMSTASTIITDMACVILPAFLLWKTQMKAQAKWSVLGLLSFASVASITTMIRAPFIQHYYHPTDDLLHYTGYIVLLSNIETGIGCVASSLPALRRLIVRRNGTTQNSKPASENLNRPSLKTFGSAPMKSNKPRGMFSNPTDQGKSFASVHSPNNGDWKRLRDIDSEISEGGSEEHIVVKPGNGIGVYQTYEVELTKLPQDQKLT